MVKNMSQLKWPIGLKRLVSLVAILLVLNIIISGSTLAIKNGTNKNDVIKNESRSASVNIHGEKTDVLLGENILIKLSAVNLITNPMMHVQVIIIPPSGMSVTSSEFSKSGSGQFSANYDLKPGDEKGIDITIKSNQVGNFSIVGRIIYYFGNDTKNIGDELRNLPIIVRNIRSENSDIQSKSKYEDWQASKAFLGIVFTALILIILIISIYLLVRRMKRYK